LRAPYAQERERYGQYAADAGFDPNSVVGPDPAAAFAPRQPQQTRTDFNSEQEAEAAAASGLIKPGQRITVGGVSGVWQ
jgi:hypothetical protein